MCCDCGGVSHVAASEETPDKKVADGHDQKRAAILSEEKAAWEQMIELGS